MRPKFCFVYMYVFVRREREGEGGEGVAYVFKSRPIGLWIVLQENPLYSLEFEFLSLDSYAGSFWLGLNVSHVCRRGSGERGSKEVVRGNQSECYRGTKREA